MRKKVLCLILLSIFVLASCKAGEEKPMEKEKKEELPKPLVSMEEKLDEIFKDIEKIQKEKEKPEEPKKEEKKDKEESKDKEKDQQGEEQGKGGEDKKKEEKKDKEKDKETTKEEKINKMWQQLDKSISAVHEGWNSYESKAVKDGVMEEDLSKFEDSINKATVMITEKKDMETLQYLNNGTFYMAKFFDLYRDHPDGDIVRMKYMIRQIYLDGTVGNTTRMNEIISGLETGFSRLNQRVELGKGNKELMDKLKLSLDNLKIATNEKNPKLLMIKRDIALKNLEKIREEAK
ncbi:hypothetical protein [Dethiothermospora halolimnae]|uniref:hypothetical protein n=1 Tax=Dethiothermospora halolimnae TaxID=3114390 RepID=UPI003CCBA1CE